MDGVERVMVLGILAVIVAILSFAWSATDESTTPVGALERGSVSSNNSGSAIPLSSTTAVGDPVVLDEAARNRITERMRTNNAAREAQLKQRWEMMNENQPAGTQGTRPPTAGQGFVPDVAGAAGGALAGSRAGARPDQLQSPDLPGNGTLQKVAGTDPTSSGHLVLGVRPSNHIPLKPETSRNDGSDGGPDAGNFRLYTVAEGDTLWGIAHRTVGASDTQSAIVQIQRLNPGLVTSSLPIGRTIKLPVDGPVKTPVTAPVGTPASDDGWQRANSLLKTTPSTGSAAAPAGRVYTVAPGDSLGAIADYELGDGGRWREIYQLNKATIPDPERIVVGQRLILPRN